MVTPYLTTALWNELTARWNVLDGGRPQKMFGGCGLYEYDDTKVQKMWEHLHHCLTSEEPFQTATAATTANGTGREKSARSQRSKGTSAEITVHAFNSTNMLCLCALWA